jgi:hypothetical protein
VRVLLVDVANVVGSRPDGWWRDRAAATGRLLDRLAGLDGFEVVAVVEGQGRAAAAPDGVTVVRAEGSGDDELARIAAARSGEDLLVVTADRGLRARLPAGTAVTGPGWLLDRLDEAGGA